MLVGFLTLPLTLFYSNFCSLLFNSSVITRATQARTDKTITHNTAAHSNNIKSKAVNIAPSRIGVIKCLNIVCLNLSAKVRNKVNRIFFFLFHNSRIVFYLSQRYKKSRGASPSIFRLLLFFVVVHKFFGFYFHSLIHPTDVE